MRYTFETFLSGMPARDYIYQKEDREVQIERAGEMLKNADAILIGAGAGMSAAAGAEYGGRFFEEHFGEFQKKYSGGFLERK